MKFEEIPALILNKHTEINRAEADLIAADRAIASAEQTYRGMIAADKELTNEAKRKAALAKYLEEDAAYQEALQEADGARLAVKTLDAELEFLRRMFRVEELRLRARIAEAELVTD